MTSRSNPQARSRANWLKVLLEGVDIQAGIQRRGAVIENPDVRPSEAVPFQPAYVIARRPVLPALPFHWG